MVDVVIDDRWWAELYPAREVRRPDLVKAFAKFSLEKFKKSSTTRTRIDVEALTKQLNGFAVELVKAHWAKPTFTADGIRVMQAPVKDAQGTPEDLRGWARVLDALGRICDPLAHYVVSYYPPLYDLRPSGLPRDVMSSLKDRARYNACIALRNALLAGVGEVGPLFDSEETVARFIEAVAAGSPLDAELHEREVILAFAAELEAYANRIAADPWHVLNKERRLAESDVSPIARSIAATAAQLRARYTGQVPTLDECAILADNLLVLVDRHISDVIRQIVSIESALIDSRGSASRTLDRLKAEAEHFDAARSSTRDELIVLLSRGHAKTEHDAFPMFMARVGGAMRRSFAAQRGKPVELPASLPPPRTAEDSQYAKFKATVVEHRDEIPGGFGEQRNGHNTAEFDAVIELFDREVTDLDDIYELCLQQWPTFKESAVADDPELLAEHVIEIIRWTAIRSGLR